MISKVLDIDEVVVVVDVLDRLGDGVGEGWLLQFFSLGYLSTLLQFVVVDDVLKIEERNFCSPCQNFGA